ncbi:MAG TPA: hypothetical protein VFS41_11835 [Edaphobacter sp.]|nr:hypothetical protein [Edaphobacter sp.]
MPFLGKKTTVDLDPSQIPALQNPLAWVEDRYLSSQSGPAAVDGKQQRRTCASPECTTSWVAPWRSRRRPIFEDRWGCSGSCVLSFVRAAVRREAAKDSGNTAAPHRHRVPLGLLMLAQGWITNAQLQYALDVQRNNGGRIGEILVNECGLAVEKVTRALAQQWGAPILGSAGFSAHQMALVMPTVLIDQLRMLPVRVAGSRILYLGFEDHLDASAALVLEQMTGLKVETGLMPTEEYRSARALLQTRCGVDLKQESCCEIDAMAARITALLEQKQPVASRLVRMGEYY